MALALVACALAIRLAVPSGFMLMPGSNGALPTITMCSGQGVMTMPMPVRMDTVSGRASHDDGRHQEKAPDHPCAFAAASAAVDLAAILHPGAPTIIEMGVRPQSRAFAQPGLGLAAPPPPKTGPPILA
ncbi:hypothetical protein NDN01_01915 [Sphingomonas sp. QA11]|uniref:hypothetical protein n=1 Tax=Sphingomonas sp. QA11 TaxID=2950605 RepID=UPI00234A52F9|nr:hypothetical protein [Sphingomonas sp. QA11]WCM27711.1 hypothetical protein NDN01_01915 [Sphingomonas sp. QA11]